MQAVGRSCSQVFTDVGEIPPLYNMKFKRQSFYISIRRFFLLFTARQEGIEMQRCSMEQIVY
jgi:hypothetical protein